MFHRRNRVALAAGLTITLIAAMTAQAAPQAAAGSGPVKTYYVTERFNRAIASVTVDASGQATVDNSYITGLPASGPDSVVFDRAGNLFISNTDAGTIEEINPATKQVVSQQVNNVTIPGVADLALDPSGNNLWAIAYGGNGIWKISLADGTTTQYDSGVLTSMGGLAFNQSGTRLFASSHFGIVYELSPADGSVIRQLPVPGEPDGMTFDPVSGQVFASGCGGLCELGIGSDIQPTLTLVKVVTAQDGDGIAADGTGKIIVTYGFCCLSVVDPSANTATAITSQINSADDVAPVVGAGAPPSQITLATDAGGPSPAMDSQPAGTSETLTATVAAGGAVQPGITVTFTVGSGPDAGLTGTAVTDASGQARFSYTGKSPGTDDILANFTDSSGTVHTSNDALVTWTGGEQPITAAGTAVTATEGQPYSGQVATFTDPDLKDVASGYSATIDWGDGTPATPGTVTGSGGSFAVTGVHTYTDEGSHKVTVTITDADNLSNTAKTTSTAAVADAGLSAALARSVSPQGFTGALATFTDANATTSSAADFTATIDWGDGSAPAAGSVRLAGGTYTVSGSHAYASTGYFTVKVHIADDGGGTADVTGKLLVFGTASGGNFVTGDRSTATGKTVTFWGDQWAMQNSLSGGPAPASFKGFEDDPAAEQCGTKWTTDPGNSTPPAPGPLPAYMTVIVSSLITQTGTSISGNTPRVAVVKTNSGYAPDPGHPGTGTVVAFACPAAPAAPALIADSPPGSATAGTAYAYSFAATGTPAPTFAVSSGALPAGLTLDAVSGLLSGTPTTPGTFTFTVKAVNGSGPDAVSPTLTITVNPAPVPPAFTADSPSATATAGTGYSYTFAATGTPGPTFALASGTLPGGLDLDTVSGLLTGTPTTPGVFTFTVKATNGIAPDAVTPALTITVQAPPAFTADSPPATATVGTPYSYIFTATGVPAPTFALASGTLPDGLALDAASGLLTGTPTTPGVFAFTVKATNGIAPDAVTPALTITVPAPPAFTADSPPATATVGTPYSYTFTATGVPAPSFALAAGALPDGLTLDAASGKLSGTPATPGIFTFIVKATNGTPPDAATPALTITVTPAPAPPAFTADSPPATAAVGTAYSYTFAATGVPAPTFALASGALPDGLTLDAASGKLSGTPTTPGIFTFTVKAANGTPPDALTLSLTITVAPAPEPPAFTADSPPASATAGTAYSYTFAATGMPAPTFALASGALPDGLTLDAASGKLSGTPTTPGIFTFTVKAANGTPPDALTLSLTITVVPAPAPPAFTADTPPASATTGTTYSYQFIATGSPPPAFAVTSGALPDGLTLEAASGVLSGTPTTPGTFTFTVKAANGVMPDATTPTLTIVVTGTAIGSTASDQSYTMSSGTELDVAAPGVLANATPSKPGLALTAVFVKDNALGTVTLHPDGSFSYVPAPGFTGADSFTFQARDSSGAVSNVATVSITVNAGGPPTPTLGTVTPGNGTTITGPTIITATLTPPSGQAITAWTVSYHRPEDPTLVQLATGTGPSVSATFDPTLVRDGTYAIDIKATASGGGVLQTESGLIVDGTYKPGRYTTTVQDLTVNAANIPINIQRTYDSTDKTQEDFGAGWSIGLSDFRIDTNGPLGARGWSGVSCDFFPFIKTCYQTSQPHVVTVTWPDGHVEKFDLTPPPSLLLNTTSSAFTAEPGTTSTLQAVDNGVTLSGSNLVEGSLLSFGAADIYDPLQFILTAKDGTQYLIDRHLGLLKVVDTHGNSITIDPTGIHSSSGPSVTFNRDAQNRITQIVGPTGTIAYSYSAAGDLTSVAYPNGTAHSYTYDASHDLLSISGGGHVVRTLTYDPSGRITSVTDGNGNTTTLSTDVTGHQQVLTDATGQLTTIDTFNDRGDLIQQDQTFGGKAVTTKYTYDALGRLLTTTDPLGRTTSQTYDAAGNVLTRIDADGHTATFTYNAFGEPLTITDPTGAVTTNTYDSAGNLLTTTDPDGKTTTYSYDSSGHLLTTTDATGRITTRTYDSSGQLASITDPGGNVTHTSVDDATGRVKSITDPTGAITTFAYDADGNLLSASDARGHTTTAAFDSFDRVTSLTDPTGATEHYMYDGAGNVISVTDRNGTTMNFTYDADSRLISKTVPGTGITTYSYDPLGRLVGAANTTAQLTFTYDDVGRVLTATTTGSGSSPLPTTTFTYTYDPAGNRTSLQGPGGTITYAYDAAQRINSLTDPAGGAFSFGYDPAGRITSLTRPNGITDTIAYDAAGDLTSLHSTLGASLVNQADYTYSAAGLRGSLTTTSGTTSYTYDAASQVTSATYPASTGMPADSYTYDSVGNRTSTAASPLGSFTYDSGDQLLGDGTSTYTYDKEGNLLTRTVKATGATTRYSWSSEHQLIGITYPDGTTASFRYDPLGRRVEIDEGTSITRYAYDQQNISAEYDGTNTLIASYVQDPATPNRALEMTRGGQRYFYLTDAQQSTTALTTMAGTPAATYTYTAFGAPAEIGSVVNPFTYTGQLYDAHARLFLFPQRAYDPSLGRFLSQDPLPSLNPYAYVSNNPANATDPSGAEATAEQIGLRVVAACSSAALASAGAGIFFGGSGFRPHPIRACLIAAPFGFFQAYLVAQVALGPAGLARFLELAAWNAFFSLIYGALGIGTPGSGNP